MTPSRVLFFDGECVMCNGVTKWLYGRDRDANLAFASLQGELAAQLREQHDAFPNDLDTFVLWDDGVVYVRSRAAARTASYLRWPWRFGALLRFVPRFIADAVYNFVARNRIRWFGKQASCWLPPADGRHRFLD